MLYLILFCLNLLYKSLDVYNSGGGVVPNSDVYKYSNPQHTANPPRYFLPVSGEFIISTEPNLFSSVRIVLTYLLNFSFKICLSVKAAQRFNLMLVQLTFELQVLNSFSRKADDLG